LALAAFAFSSIPATAASAPAAGTTAPAAPAAQDSLAIGQPAPVFTLPAQDGKPVGPKDFPGKWVVLYFYPKDFTGGCTLEAHNFQRDSAAYARANAVILGVSLDSRDSHERFCAKEGLTFKLLADSAGAVSARYASLHSILGKKLSARNTYLIDPEGKIARIFRGVKPAEHSSEVLAALGELRKP
jgi:peroxiredoxin Q/BCP